MNQGSLTQHRGRTKFIIIESTGHKQMYKAWVIKVEFKARMEKGTSKCPDW